MKNVTIKSVLTAGGTITSREWNGKSEKDVVRMERQLVRVLARLVEAGADHSEGKRIQGISGDRGTLLPTMYEFSLFDANGAFMHSTTVNYDGLAPDEIEWIKGLLAGEMRDFEADAKKDKIRRKG